MRKIFVKGRPKAMALPAKKPLPRRKIVFAREYKKFGIVPSRKPQVGSPVAGVVVIAGREGPGVVYVKFSEHLVEAVGKALPYGVSEATPCYLKATCLPTGRWRISAHYLGLAAGCVLWESSRPSWIKKVHKGECNGTHSETEKGQAGGAGDAGRGSA